MTASGASVTDSGQRVGQERALAILCYGLFELQLMLRFRDGLRERGWKVVAVTHLLSVWWRAKRSGIDCVLLKPGPGVSEAPDILLDQTPEGVLKVLPPKDAERYRHSLWRALERTEKAYDLKAIVQFNGLRLGGRIAKAFGRSRGIQTVFLELGNIEPKLFADHEGVNAASRLAEEPERLDAFVVSDDEIAAWRADFIERKRRIVSIPQARGGVLRRTNFWFPLEWMGAVALRIPQALPLTFLPKVLSKIRQMMKVSTPAIRPAKPYIFLPLQVSDDSNLLLFSQYDNLAAIDYAQARASDKNLDLVIKPHPAERDIPMLARIAALCAERGHILTSYNTADLVLGSEEVITINSTVGMEAMVMGKAVTLLGDSLYGRFSARQASVFAMRYLLDISPFGYDPPAPGELDRFVRLLDGETLVA